MKRIAKFHKVSKERFVADWMDAFEGATVEEAEKIYEGIRLPRRATAGSAGYDFFFHRVVFLLFSPVELFTQDVTRCNATFCMPDTLLCLK